jgi:hypothetical protein
MRTKWSLLKMCLQLLFNSQAYQVRKSPHHGWRIHRDKPTRYKPD